MKKKIYLLLLMSLALVSYELQANNVRIESTPVTANQNTSAGVNDSTNYTFVQFDLSWDNSWRNPSNFDAAWIFIKYRIGNSGIWNHCSLSALSSDHYVGNNNGISATIEGVSDKTGVFIHRTENGYGDNNWDAVTIRWNYGLNGVPDNADITVKVFVIEMVYVPQEPFYLGSGGNELGHFYTYPTSVAPYLITNENAINVGNTSGYLYYTTGTTYGDGSGPVPASFPKGYHAFYCMKYEITQEQYVDFLNNLNLMQRPARFADKFNYERNYIKTINWVASCDKDNDGIVNESVDGQNIACNYLSWADGAAYADWAGLRPMTELEFEKASRGSSNPLPNEYIWGTNTISQATSITNSGSNNEIANTGANCVYNSAAGVQGPMRAGCFATSSSNRQQAGATFYGIMEMGGNLYERVVTIGNAAGLSFTGEHGNGQLLNNGDADVIGWPSLTTAIGTGYRGGYWGDAADAIQISNRTYAAFTDVSRSKKMGFRGVRTAP